MKMLLRLHVKCLAPVKIQLPARLAKQGIKAGVIAI